ncbi:MAG TPA: NAD(P)H-dependent oxidoreductase subunit E [Planctomycetaceae bacterium]|jgi:NADH-quinone oxidoreductase subunit E|nr:NAD(P)H-dependent oxidoreductase subunit E [Planctomycetaceae bacterium]
MSALSEETKQRIRAEFPKYANKRAVTLPALHIVQDEHRCVSREAIREVAALLELPPAEVYDTLSFYGFFRDESAPLGKHRVWVCRSLSCALRGGEELLEEISAKLGAEPGKTTTDGKITLEFAECLGACEGAPCLLVDDECHMNMTAASADNLIRDLK